MMLGPDRISQSDRRAWVTMPGDELRTADVASYQRRTADVLDATGCAATARGRPARRCDRPDRGIVHAGRRFGGITADDAGGVVNGRGRRRRGDRPVPERVRRRRNDVEFDVEAMTPWQVYGDTAGLLGGAEPDDNAAKWSPSGQRVGVRLRQLNATHAELVVSDHGPGIPTHERALVFERFFRSTTARAMPGSGLGLAIVKQVRRCACGALRVEDTVPGRRYMSCCRLGVLGLPDG